MSRSNSTEGATRRQENALRVLFSRKPVAYYPELAEALDSVAAAIFLQEICHWERWSRDGWVFRTQDEIKEATALKRAAQEGARRVLKKMRVIEEELRGVPARLHYRVKHENLAMVLAIQIAESSIQECGESTDKNAENPQTIYTGKDTPEDASVSPNGESAPAEEPPAAPEAGKVEYHDFSPAAVGEPGDGEPIEAPRVKDEEKPVALEKYVTDQIYELMRDSRMRLANSDYPYHLGRAKEMLAKDAPTDEELEALPNAFKRLFIIKGRADAPSALVELRRQAERGHTIAESGAAGQAPSVYQKAEKAEKEDRPRRVEWYTSVYPQADAGKVERMIREGRRHAHIVDTLEGRAH